jgi:hypothetical protein
LPDQDHAPIAFDRAHRVYYYTEPAFRLSLSRLSQRKLVALFLAERIMHQLRGTPFDPDLRQAIAKLDALLPDRVSVRLDAVAGYLSVLAATQFGITAGMTAGTSIAKARFPRRREKPMCAAPSQKKIEPMSDPVDGAPCGPDRRRG